MARRQRSRDAAPARLRAAGSRCTLSASPITRRVDAAGPERDLRSAVHGATIACRSSSADLVRRHLQNGIVPAEFRRRHRHRSRWQPLLRSDRLLRRQSVRLRLLPGVHRSRRRDRPGNWGRCLAPIIRSSRTTRSDCVRSRGSTKCRFTCPARKPSCRRCDWRAITRGDRHVVTLLRCVSRLVG